MKKRLVKLTISKFSLLLLLSFFIGCNSQKVNNKYDGEIDRAFKEYLIAEKISFKELNNDVYSAYFSGFLKYEKKLKLEANPYLKVNKVYVHYRTPTSVEFTVYSDEETFCISTFDLDMDGKILSFPENGIVKVLESIKVSDFGDFEIIGNVIKTRKRHKTPYKEWYEYVNGSIKNDTIHFTVKYIGRDHYKFKKNWLAKTTKTDLKEVYQPNLKARKYKNGVGLIYYEVTGEFNVEK
jgi:hypothetical protein